MVAREAVTSPMGRIVPKLWKEMEMTMTDMNLALKMMDTSWLMLFSHTATSATIVNAGHPNKEEQVPSWAVGQLPRVLCCIGNGGDTTIK